jgi:hypothetical protein
MNRNLVESIYGRFSIKSANFVPIHIQTWPPQAILVSDLLIFLKSFPLTPLCQMNQNLVGSIYGRLSIKFAHLIPIHLQWESGFRGEDFLEINQSETSGVHVCKWINKK